MVDRSSPHSRRRPDGRGHTKMSRPFAVAGVTTAARRRPPMATRWTPMPLTPRQSLIFDVGRRGTCRPLDETATRRDGKGSLRRRLRVGRGPFVTHSC
jgi:hypothetical protein